MNSKPVTAASPARGDPFGLVGTRLGARYDVVEFVAQGGFGVVYRAQHTELLSRVAIKVLKTPADFTERQQREFLQRFSEEARTVARLDHPHIVRVLDSGTSTMPSGASAPWMALEWLEGVSLEADFDARIETGAGGRTPAECLALMYPVLEAVAVAHEEGVVHRDIKPGNLMLVTGRRGDPRLKLLDFGVAKVMAPEDRRPADRAQTLTQVQAFSPDYAAPEQVSGMRTGPWTDVHALALVMSEMLTATVPFAGADTMEICASVIAPLRPTPGRRGVDVGPWEAVFARALAVRPSDRYESAGELLAALMVSLPAGVDPLDAQLLASQSGANRFTPAPAVVPRASSWPPGEPARAPGAAPRTGPLLAPPRAPSPPAGPSAEALSIGHAPTLLAMPVPASLLASAARTLPPPTSTPSFPPATPQAAIPTERLARPRSFVAPVLVLIGLGFGGLVAGAVVLLLRPHPPAARTAVPPVAVVRAHRPAQDAASPAPVAAVAVALGDAAVLDAAVLDAAVLDAAAADVVETADAPAAADATGDAATTGDATTTGDAAPDEAVSTGRSRHRSHRHRDRTHHSHRHRHE